MLAAKQWGDAWTGFGGPFHCPAVTHPREPAETLKTCSALCVAPRCQSVPRTLGWGLGCWEPLGASSPRLLPASQPGSAAFPAELAGIGRHHLQCPAAGGAFLIFITLDAPQLPAPASPLPAPACPLPAFARPLPSPACPCLPLPAPCQPPANLCPPPACPCLPLPAPCQPAQPPSPACPPWGARPGQGWGGGGRRGSGGCRARPTCTAA